MKRLFPIFLLLCWMPSLKGQSWSLETTVQRGRILKHTPKIAYPIPSSSNGITVEWLCQTDGHKDWQEHHGYPLFGLAFRYYHLGDPAILGHSIGLYPNLHLTLVAQPRWSMHFTLGSGLAILTRSFDRLENPLNNAIGSSVNNITAFSLRFNLRLSERLSLAGQGSFTHFSNAATSLPNLGINIPALAIGARYYPKGYSEDRLEGHSKIPTRSWGGFVFSGVGFKETALPGGAKWPIYFSSAGVLYRWSRFHQIQLSADYEYQSSLYAFSLHTYTFTDPQEARLGATRFGLSIFEEFLFGHWAITLNAGVYLSGQSLLLPYPVYNRLGIRYYGEPWGQDGLRWQLGLYMKSHLIVAEYAGLAFGLSW